MRVDRVKYHIMKMRESDREESGDEYSNDGFGDNSDEEDSALESQEPGKNQEQEQEDGMESMEDDEEVERAKLQILPNAVTEAELQSDDTELILFRMPRHERLKGSLKGSELNIPVADNVIDKKAGIYQGRYVFRDRGTKTCKHMRPVFVTRNSRGDPRLHVGTLTSF